MARSKLVGFVFEAWADIDRVTAGLINTQAVVSLDGGSTFAWTYGHVANQLDAWINVRFTYRTSHPVIGRPHFRMGADGVVNDWSTVHGAVGEVRECARGYLEGLTEDALD